MFDASDQRVTCRCGTVVLQVSDTPIMTTECFCDSCRKAGKVLGDLPEAAPLLEANGGTRSVMQRKDRVACLRGADRLREFRLKPESRTRRVVADCCNAAMFLDFERGHWIDLYARRWPDGVGPAPEMRTMVGDLPSGSASLPSDIPNLEGHSASFYARLIAAWVAMRFRTPAIPWGKGMLIEQGEKIDA